MKPILTPAAMRAGEARAFARTGIPSIEFMERAAGALARTVREAVPQGGIVFLACGPGGNGGDGLACARLLRPEWDARVVLCGEPATPDACENLARAQAAGVPVLTEIPDAIPDAWVDCLFGTGLSRSPEGGAAALIHRINADGVPVVAADIPSGLNGQTGEAFPVCVKADRTVTFQYLKSGLILRDGLDVSGRVTAADIGFEDRDFGAPDALLMEPSDLPKLLPRRRRNLHKGDCGRLLIVAGSQGMAGAALLCARAALRGGAGLVQVACPASIVPILQLGAPQATCLPLPEWDGAIAAEAAPLLEEALKAADAAVVGPGLSRKAAKEALRAVLRAECPAVVDADALNLIAAEPELAYLLRERHILTPHPGEARRLPAAPPAAGETGRIDPADPLAAARRLAGLGGTALLKGAATVVASETESYISQSGCEGMARGGSGDILSGLMGALLAEKPDRSYALTAALASELHGLAGERAQRAYGSRGMNAADILEFLPQVFPA